MIKSKNHLLTISLLSIIIAIIYSNTLNSSWHFDDYENIVDNRKIHMSKLTLSSIRDTFYSLNNNPNKLYRPVACFTFALNWYFGQDSVVGYHVINILIHIISAIFLYLAILQLFFTPLLNQYDYSAKYFTALLSACLWAINPIQIQAITYIVQRMASLSAMFYIIAIYLYLKGRLTVSRKNRIFFFIAIFIAYLLSFGSKQNGVMLPFSLLLIEVIFFNFTIKLPSKKTTWFILLLGVFTVSLIFITELLDSSIFDIPGKRSFTIYQRLLTQPRVILFYISQILYPIASRFSIVHDFEISTSAISPISTAISIIVIISIIGIGFLCRKRLPLLSFAIFFFFLNHLIESTILPLEMVFEHRNYLPSAFIFTPIIFILHQMVGYYRNNNIIIFLMLYLFISGLITVTGTATYLRNFDWITEESLWLDAMEKAPDSDRGYQNYSKVFIDSHDSRTLNFDSIFEVIRKSLDKRVVGTFINRNVIAYNNMGAIRSYQKRYKEALYYYKKSLALAPDKNNSIVSISKVYLMLNEHKKALKILSKLRTKNNHHLNLYSLTFVKNGMFDKSIEVSNKIRVKEPDDYFALLHLGSAYKMKGNYKKSKHYLQHAIRVSNGSLLAYFNMLDTCLLSNDTECMDIYADKILDRFTLKQILKEFDELKEPNLTVPISKKNEILLYLKDLTVKRYSEIKVPDESH
ncbi:MAG: tetratricopeptide repeat protein [Desulfamplus sp.]|nr:tetratricopeptide repeat protein [Desulfamplus sp.]